MSEQNHQQSELLYAVDNGIATITLNRPERRNSLTPLLTRLLHDAWQKLENDPAVRVAILTATACGTFCAGMDLREAARLKAETGKDILEHLTDPFNHSMRAMRKPVIAAINGHFPAGGMALAGATRLHLLVEACRMAHHRGSGCRVPSMSKPRPGELV